MLHIDEDDFFVGSPKSKFFDILFNANRNLVQEKLLDIVDRYNAMELLLEKNLGKSSDEIESLVKTTLFEEADEILKRSHDFFISTVGDILTKNE